MECGLDYSPYRIALSMSSSIEEENPPGEAAGASTSNEYGNPGALIPDSELSQPGIS